MFITETTIRVRYGETDQMGLAYYGNYAQYYEVGRVEALRTIGMDYKQVEESGVIMPVVKMECNFIRGAKYDDLLTIKTIIQDLPVLKFHVHYEISNAEKVLINKGETTLVFIDAKTNKLIRCPEWILAKLKPFFS
ncbi:MAG: acyl-CoA thioesterase [Bacteroidia bacterium]